ncbi:MAG: nitrous oxide reductase family maturation protein NosD [Cyclobacteriaceae bacterium]
MRLVPILILILLYFQAKSAKIIVCKSCNYSTLQLAVSAAGSFDTILVKPGIYSSINLELTKPITLIGMSGGILDGNGEGYVLKLLADSISVSGFKVINSGRSYTKDFAAIYAYRVKHFNISDMEIIDPFFGILLEKSKNGNVKNNKVYGVSKREDDSGNGIHLWHCSDVVVEDNEVFGLRDGIYLEFVDKSKVRKNYTHNNIRYGLHFMFSNEDEYVENTFENNGAGVAVMFSKFIVMKQNRFIRNWGTASYGLLLKEIYDAEVIGNEFIENTIGIFIEGSTRINYSENLYEQNGWAIKVSGGCYENKFFTNNFIGNSFDVSYNTKMNDNSFNGNYWSDYTGYDLNKDGIGDVPYRPVKLFSYIVNKTPETIILLRSLFVDIINFSEKVSPVFTPDDLIDNQPATYSF